MPVNLTANKDNFMQENFKLLYSTNNAAAMLDISRSHFYNIVKKYNIQPVRILGDSRWRHEDLLRLINGEIPAEN